jgi:hypothetical protein
MRYTIETARHEAEIRAANRRGLDLHAALVAEYEAGVIEIPSLSKWDLYGTGDNLSADEQAERNALIIRRDAATARRVSEWDNRYIPQVVAYEDGAGRPEWKSKWGGSEMLLDRIRAEDTRRTEADKIATRGAI